VSAEPRRALDNAVSSLVVLKSRLTVCLAAMQAGNDTVSPEDVAGMLDDLIANRLVGVIEDLSAIKEESTSMQGGTAMSSSTHNVIPTRPPDLPEGVFTDDNCERTPLPGLPAALACPFCGKFDDIMITKVSADEDNREPWFRANCGNCGVDAPGETSLALAAAMWNTRGKLGLEGAQP
jgi:hypothetical protein